MTGTSTRRRKFTVVLEARIEAGVQGGVQQVIVGLAGGLARVGDPRLRYVYVTGPDSSWLQPHVGDTAEIVHLDGRRPPSLPSRLARAGATVLPLWAQRRAAGVPEDPLPANLAADAIHFMTQNGWQSSVPFIYSPHDLLHLHRPRDFDRYALTARTIRYAWLSRNAAFVIALTRAGQRDIANAYGIPVARIPVVPNAALVTPEALGLNGHPAPSPPAPAFILFPGKPWRHKNHVRLMHAVALCHRQGVPVHVVLTGLHAGLPSSVSRVIHRHGLEGFVHPLGQIDERALAGLYRAARGLIYPSLFEGFGIPIVEAESFSLPVACSNIPVLREVAAPGTRFFNPESVEEIASALAELWAGQVTSSAPVGRPGWDDIVEQYVRLHRQVVGLSA